MIRCPEPGCGMYVKSRKSLGGHYTWHHSDPDRARVRPVRQPVMPTQAVPGDWADRAACKAKTDQMFPPVGMKGADVVRFSRAAKLICAGCTVRRECLNFAVANNERFGVWGGLAPKERRAHIIGRRVAG